MQTRVSVQTSARLHLGFLDLNGGLGRRFGSFGLAIDRPVTALTIFRASQPSVEGPEAERIAAHIEVLKRHLNLSTTYGVRIEEAIPAHAGLGSGTQLAFALAAGLRRLEGLPEDFAGDALLLQRGRRSGIGAALFSRGGLVVDGGHGPRTVLPPVLCHLPFPEDWRIIIVMDSTFAGVHGADERAAFAALPQFPAAAAADICHRLLMQALPALAERDLAQFGAAVGHIQVILGDYFAPAQGGARYTSARVAEVIGRLAHFGAQGIGQSSWGPTGFAFAASDDEAQRLVRQVREERRAQKAEDGADPVMVVCKAINRGARITASSVPGDIRNAEDQPGTQDLRQGST
ncbi:GHMP kinase [Methylovirgula ligni]|uniref:Beta-RFAP synthase n=1 Tax=Methylovirgula ligni TaxID=569860 RepID=A0A3D9Z2E1_9HYPH|nr:beta-ribofuranosylaminobenzene 5'-phosphate synthase family protein [Methylovirgula ligni]QAY95348.1 GHMP kinase [Methylovirgula ligni]REF89342.1 beta-RFAP synthase [Methylovirgula ligni]